MTWRRFSALVRGLSASSWWWTMQRAEMSKPKVLTGKQVDAYFSTL